jgi:hypothetical protein
MLNASPFNVASRTQLRMPAIGHADYGGWTSSNSYSSREWIWVPAL